MKLKFFSILAPAFLATLTLSAQVKVLAPTGKVKVGIETPVGAGSDDPDSKVRLHVYGPNGDFRAGGKIAIGDFGGMAWNVFVGEYQDNDVDQLWLNGRLGMYLTYGQYGEHVIGYFNANTPNETFHFDVGVTSSGFYSASDARFKTNIKKLGNTLEQLKKLDGVSYNLLPHVLDDINKSGVKSPASKSGAPLGEKERKAQAFADELEKQQNQPGPKRLGLIAQEVQKIYPELVIQDSSNYLYVDYMGFIPLLLEGVKEQEAIIDAQNEKIQELESRLGTLEGKVSGLSNTETGMPGAASVAGSTSFLYQNTPNPFRAATTISYFLSAEAKEADVNIFDMQGTLIKAYPLAKQAGKGQVSINGSELKAGMYIYNLIIDGQEADVKRMTLIK